MSLLSCIARKFRRDEGGAVLVEMTLVAPLMISLAAGVFEFGNLIHQKLLIEAGLRDAARYAARCSSSMSVTCETSAKNLAATGTVVEGGNARVAGWAAENVNMSYLATPVVFDGFGNPNYHSTNLTVYTVRLSTSFPYTGTSLLSYLGFGSITLAATHEERMIGW